MVSARACVKYLDISSLGASVLQAASLELLDKKAAKQCYRCSTSSATVPTVRQKSHRSKMYVTAVQMAEFLIMVVILMSLPKLVTS